MFSEQTERHQSLPSKHVAFVHMNSWHPEAGDDAVVFTPHEVRSYVARARTYRPVVHTRVSEYMRWRRHLTMCTGSMGRRGPSSISRGK